MKRIRLELTPAEARGLERLARRGQVEMCSVPLRSQKDRSTLDKGIDGRIALIHALRAAGELDSQRRRRGRDDA